jgi:hypothetical protein
MEGPPCLSTDQDKMSNLYRGPSIDAFYQVSVHLAKNHMERMHMWSSFKILIEDLRLSSNMAVTVTKNRKLQMYCQKTYFKIR